MTQSQGVITPNASRAPNTTPVVKILLAIAGGFAGLVAIGLLFGGVLLVVVHTTQRNDDGFLTSPDYDLSTDQYALVSGEIDLASHPGDWWPADPGTVKFNVDPVDGKSVFVGIGPESDVDAYLSSVAFDEITSLGARRGDVKYRTRSGGAPASLPGEQNFWVEASQGTGEQVLEWELENGKWKLVLMNADGSRGIRTDVEAGAKIGILLPIGIGLIVAGVVGLIVTAVLLTVAVRLGRSKNGTAPAV